MFDWLFKEEVQQIINQYSSKDAEKMLLSKSIKDKGYHAPQMVQQIKGKAIAEHKYPFLLSYQKIVYPVQVSIEQASSELTAIYKANEFKANTVVDLTSGMGIDDYFFSRYAERVVAIELNKELADITTHNFIELGATNIQVVNDSAESFIASNTTAFDLVYVDPSRRKSGDRLSNFEEWMPNVIALKSDLYAFSNRILVKLSPMVDLQKMVKEFEEVKEIHVVSLNNDCKEVLLNIEKGFSEEPIIHVVMLKHAVTNRFAFLASSEQQCECIISDVKKYLYEPDAAILKAGAFKTIAEKFELSKLHIHTHLYTSEELKEDFFGKKFEVLECLIYTKANILNFINESKDFHVLTRNSKYKSEQIKLQFKLIERGDMYLILYKNYEGNEMIVKAKRLF